ncbi:hypothetical protein Btru_034079 [Bulinus truncatus]|nr:hypothetical protein Btru_034079 [Bulinus truncatus]
MVLNEMNVTRADIPCHGLVSLCPNVVDLDLANNLLDKWTELLSILSHLPKVKYVNVSRNSLRLNMNDPFPETELSVENLALNDTGVTFEEIAKLSAIMPRLKELHLCGNNYDNLADIDARISDGALSSLECLRLNNNRITSWSEVWKLRYLPHLKFLVLSGNPVKDVFYEAAIPSSEKDVKPSEEVGQEDSGAGDLLESQGPTRLEDNCTRCAQTSPQAPETDSRVSSNCEQHMPDHVGVNNLGLQEDISDADVFDNQDGDGSTSMSRCNNPLDSEDSDEISDRERLDSDCDDIMSNVFGSDGFPDNSYFNCSQSSFGLCSDRNLYLPSDIQAAQKDNNSKPEKDIHPTLYGINSISVTCGTDFFRNDNESAMNSNLTTVHPKRLEKTNTTCEKSIYSSLKTIGHPSSGFDLYQIIRPKEMEMDPFTPRAFLFDEESLTPVPCLGDAVKTFKPKAQRCLFKDDSDCRAPHDKHVDSCSNTPRPHSRSESDSCSDIEAEQRKCSTAVLAPDHLASCLHFCSLDNTNFVLENTQVNLCTDSQLTDRPNHPDSSNNASDSDIRMHRPTPGCCESRPAAEVQQSSRCSENRSPEMSTHSKNVSSSCGATESESSFRPFEQLQILCLSNASLSHYNHLIPFMLFPKLTNLR